MSFNGKTALITGRSRGIGRGIALEPTAKGVNFAVHYYQNKTAANDNPRASFQLEATGVLVSS